ncbi:MAG TPA: ArsR family transcriptional regulator [Streptosporangiaceae bacterium]|nr:ArsR family transcriptional regulator [Streptosporangiaceae bacterium]
MDEERLLRLEERVARLEAAGAAGAPAAGTAEPAVAGDDDFWALHELQNRFGEPGAVLLTGSVTVPGAGHVDWQEGQLADGLLAEDWSQAAAALAALAHPVRLLLVREVLLGTQTAARLSEHPRLGTSGQLYHHLRQLVAAGWLRSSARGQYAVPAERVVPLLVTLAAARR